MEASAGGFVRSEIERTRDVLRDVLADAGLLEAIDRAATACIAAIRTGDKILLAGNSGSAADAQHLAAELVGKLGRDRANAVCTGSP